MTPIPPPVDPGFASATLRTATGGRRGLRWAVVSILMLGLGACGNAEQSPGEVRATTTTIEIAEATTIPPSPVPPAPSTTMEVGGENPDEAALTPGVGQGLFRSDTADIPDSALTSGDVLFIELVTGDELINLAGIADSDLPYASFQLDQDRLADLDGVGVAIDEGGFFPIPVRSGSYAVCLANIFVGHIPGPPYAVVGCVTIELPADAALKVWHGEGGVEVALEPPSPR